jgi:hypothetical protein
MPGWPLFIPLDEVFIMNLVVPPTCGDLREHTDSADRRWRTVAGQADRFISHGE